MIRLCLLDDIPEGGARGVLPDRRGRDRVLLVRLGDSVVGYVNNCPHYDRAPLGWRKDEFLNGDGTRIMCAAHGALFRLDDGVCELGPCLGQALTPVAVEIRDGYVCVTDASTLPPTVRPQTIGVPRPGAMPDQGDALRSETACDHKETRAGSDPT